MESRTRSWGKWGWRESRRASLWELAQSTLAGEVGRAQELKGARGRHLRWRHSFRSVESTKMNAAGYHAQYCDHHAGVNTNWLVGLKITTRWNVASVLIYQPLGDKKKQSQIYFETHRELHNYNILKLMSWTCEAILDDPGNLTSFTELVRSSSHTAGVVQQGFREWLPGVPAKIDRICLARNSQSLPCAVVAIPMLHSCTGIYEQRKHLRKVPLQQKGWKTLSHSDARSHEQITQNNMFFKAKLYKR